LGLRSMNGIQFCLRDDVPLAPGHSLFLDAPFGLTSLSQAQFWPGVRLASRGDGTVNGVLSVDIADWETPGILYGKPASQLTAEEVKEEVWAQLKGSLPDALDDDNLATWFLDPAIVAPNPSKTVNLEPLLIN